MSSMWHPFSKQNSLLVKFSITSQHIWTEISWIKLVIGAFKSNRFLGRVLQILSYEYPHRKSLTLRGLCFLRGSLVRVGVDSSPSTISLFSGPVAPNVSWFKFNVSSIGYFQKNHEIVFFRLTSSLLVDDVIWLQYGNV